MKTCREIKSLFTRMREKTSKALGFAKVLRKDLEIAAEFRILSKPKSLMEMLFTSGHVQVRLRATVFPPSAVDRV